MVGGDKSTFIFVLYFIYFIFYLISFSNETTTPQEQTRKQMRLNDGSPLAEGMEEESGNGGSSGKNPTHPAALAWHCLDVEGSIQDRTIRA